MSLSDEPAPGVGRSGPGQLHDDLVPDGRDCTFRPTADGSYEAEPSYFDGETSPAGSMKRAGTRTRASASKARLQGPARPSRSMGQY